MVKKIILEWRVGKYKDLPTELKSVFFKDEGALPKVAYEGGKFFKLLWVQAKPLYWPEKVKIALSSDDSIVMFEDFGIEARLLGFYMRNLLALNYAKEPTP